FSSRRRHTRSKRDWSSDVCSSDLVVLLVGVLFAGLTPWALLGLLALPLATKPVRGLRAAKDDPHALVPSNAAMIMAMLATGILLLVGLALSAILRNPLTGV